jgi:hypothetical protein
MQKLRSGAKKQTPAPDPNAMDVDAIRTHPDGRLNLTDKQKEALKILGGCFRCGNIGHISRNCSKFPQEAKPGWSGATPSKTGGRGPGPKAQIRAVEEKPSLSTEELKTAFKEAVMALPEEERADYCEEVLPDF